MPKTEKTLPKTRAQKLWARLIEVRKTAPVSNHRARLLTESWKSTEGLPTPIRRARAVEKILTEIPIYIDEEQLIAGNYASASMSIEWRPEITVEWFLKRFDEGRNHLNIREKDIPEMLAIADYWKDKSVVDRYHLYVGVEEEKRLKTAGFLGTKIGHVYYPPLSSQGWCIPDYAKAINKGFTGILQEVEDEIKTTQLIDQVTLEKKIFLEALCIVIRAGIRYASRHALLARELARSASGKRKKELLKMAEICEWVPANPARTFQEALQTLWFCHLFIFFDSKNEGVSPGRVDQYLFPYFKKDVEQGVLTSENAIELLELLRCHFSCYRHLAEAKLAEFIAADANWFNCMLGGQTADGKDATNELSFLWLEAAERTSTPHPTLSVRVHANMNDEFFLKAVELCSKGHGYPAFFGDKSNIDFLINQGIPKKDAADYAIAGCTLTQVPGKMDAARVFGGNMPKMLELALNDGLDPGTGVQAGPHTGKFDDFNTYDELYHAYGAQVRQFLKQSAVDHRQASLFQVSVLPHLFPSLLVDDCIKRGRPLNGGGPRYEQGMWYLLPQGPIDVADSLAAIKKCVYEDRTLTKSQLLAALEADFEGDVHLDVRSKLLSAPKYGNDDDYVDLIARDVYSMLDKELAKIDACYGAKYVQAPHSLTGHGAFGRAVGALPSGRHAGLALADGNASPAQGMDKKGITAVLNSSSKLDQMPMQGCLLNQKIHPSALQTKNDLKKFMVLIKTYLTSLEGKHIQFNVTNRETLLEAREHPENHRSLVVRVAGYSALWIELDQIMQDEIIARTEQTL